MFVPNVIKSHLSHVLPDRSRESTYLPAHVQYVMIFSPGLTDHLGPEDPARLTGQLLFYTSAENAVPRVQMVRQIALANAFIEFGVSMQRYCHPDTHETLRKLAVRSTKQCFYLVEVVPDMWLHACIVLPQWKVGDEVKSLAWISDAWMHRQMLDAWHSWRLQYGSPHVLLHEHGRDALESRLEPFFSKWTWLWDVDAQYAPVLRASDPKYVPSGLVAETVPAIASASHIGPDDLSTHLTWFAEKSKTMPTPSPMDMLLLYDDEMLWPRPHSNVHPSGDLLQPEDRRHVARYVLERLVGLSSVRSQAAVAFAAKPKKAAEPPASEQQSSSPNVLRDLSYMTDMLGDIPSFMNLNNLWPNGSIAESDRATETHAERVASSSDQRTTRAAPSAPATQESSSVFQAFHARLEQALGEAETPAEPGGKMQYTDQAARQLEEITNAYARAAAAQPRTRARRKAGAQQEQRSSQRTSWYASHQAAGTVPTKTDIAHDFDLDGWGPETPARWRRATLYVDAHDIEPLHAASAQSQAIDIVYMTRQLLTVVLVWPHGAVQGREQALWEGAAWDLLRRVQRTLNDARRHTEKQGTSSEPPYFHYDTLSAQSINELTRSKRQPPLVRGAESQLLTSQAWMETLGIKETLAHAEDNSFWVASRCAQEGHSQTFITLQGAEQRHYGVSECDHQMRRLAVQHSEFGL